MGSDFNNAKTTIEMSKTNAKNEVSAEEMKKEEKSEITNFWLVGAYFNDHNENMYETFIKENRWENGYDDKYQDKVKEIKVGDKIVIKSSFTQKYELPFNNHDRIVSVMRIKAIGTVTSNKNDGKNVGVKWEKLVKPRDWYGQGVYQSTINKVTSKGLKVFQELKGFIFDNLDEDMERLEEYYKEHEQNEVNSGEEGDETDIIMKIPNNQPSANFERFNKNTILYGPPGTGKTYNTVAYAVAICKLKTKEELEDEEEFKDTLGYVDHDKIFNKYEEFRKAGRIKFITFHQSYGYEEFIEGIKPKLDINKITDLQYEIKDGSFKAFCKQANPACICNNSADNEHTGSTSNQVPYVFIIDEINRGNISKIFGELITLVEPNKRFGAREERWATLPYSEDSFCVPDNVYILGTMNTADRSIALMDTALRRRFHFIEMIPNTKILKDVTIKDGSGEKVVNVMSMLDTINKRIEYLYDREHTIGHGFFTSLIKKENQNMDNLRDIFKNKIIPLLQEYFYDDYKKIQLVLGDNDKSIDKKYMFIKEISNEKESLFKGSDDIGFDIPQVRYEINPDAFENIESYIKIYTPSNDLKKISENTDAEQKTS